MHRTTSVSPQLEALQEARDDLKIQIHIAGERGTIDPVTLSELRAELRELEKKIELGWRKLNQHRTH